MYQEILSEKGELFNETILFPREEYTGNLTWQIELNTTLMTRWSFFTYPLSGQSLHWENTIHSEGNGQSVMVLKCFHSRAKHGNTLQKSILNVCIVTQQQYTREQ